MSQKWLAGFGSPGRRLDTAEPGLEAREEDRVPVNLAWKLGKKMDSAESGLKAGE